MEHRSSQLLSFAWLLLVARQQPSNICFFLPFVWICTGNSTRFLSADTCMFINLYSAYKNRRAIDVATNYPHPMCLKVSSKPIPGAMTREPRFSMAVDGAEDLEASQGVLVNPHPPWRGSPNAFSPSVSLLQQHHRKGIQGDLVTESWASLGSVQSRGWLSVSSEILLPEVGSHTVVDG